MTPTALQPRIPDALPVEVEPPRVFALPPRPPEAPEGGPGLKPLEYLRYRWATVVFLGGLLAVGPGVHRLLAHPGQVHDLLDHPRRPPGPEVLLQRGPARPRRLRQLPQDPGRRPALALRPDRRPARPRGRRPAHAQGPGRPGALPRRGDADRLRRRVGADQAEALRRRPAGHHHDRQRHPRRLLQRGGRGRAEAEAGRGSKQIEDSVTAMQQDLEKKLPPPARKDDQPAESLPGVGPSVAASQVARLREKLDAAEVRQKQIEEEKKRLARRREHPDAELPGPAGVRRPARRRPGDRRHQPAGGPVAGRRSPTCSS